MLTGAVKTPLAGGRTEPWEATVTDPSDDAGRERKRGFTVRILITAEEEPPIGAANAERRATVRAVVFLVESPADDLGE